jgi:hypothetical protein
VPPVQSFSKEDFVQPKELCTTTPGFSTYAFETSALPTLRAVRDTVEGYGEPVCPVLGTAQNGVTTAALGAANKAAYDELPSEPRLGPAPCGYLELHGCSQTAITSTFQGLGPNRGTAPPVASGTIALAAAFTCST